jgi:Uma2 family endonuclease
MFFLRERAIMVVQTAQLKAAIVTDEWTAVGWPEFVQLIEKPEYQKVKAYYHDRKMRLETMPVGSDHAQAHATLIFIIGLYAMFKGIALSPKDNCTFRKVGYEEFQPDIAYGVGDNANRIPKGTRIVDLDQYPLPDLVIEVADTTLSDDIGGKRLQYEALGVREYWVWNVQAGTIVAFTIGADGSSRRIPVSLVLPELDLALLETAMQRSWESDQSAVGQWLMQQWQA